MDYVEQWKERELSQTMDIYSKFLDEYEEQLRLDKERCDRHNLSYNYAVQDLGLEEKSDKKQLTDEDKEAIDKRRREIWKECDAEYEEFVKWKSSHSYFYDIVYKTKYNYYKHNGQVAINQALDIFKKDIDKHFDQLQAKVEKKIGKIIKIESYGGDDYAFEGENGKCVVEVILAGGYNIQRLHTRWIVKNWNID